MCDDPRTNKWPILRMLVTEIIEVEQVQTI
jgi:hypothetical protein